MFLLLLLFLKTLFTLLKTMLQSCVLFFFFIQLIVKIHDGCHVQHKLLSGMCALLFKEEGVVLVVEVVIGGDMVRRRGVEEWDNCGGGSGGWVG